MIEMPTPCVHCGEIYDLNDLWPDYNTPTSEGYAVQCKDCKRSRENSED